MLSKYTDVYKHKISECVMGNKNPFYGKKHTDENKKHMSYIMSKLQSGENNAFYGKRHSSDSKELISNKLKNKTKRIIEIYNLDKKFIKEGEIDEIM